MSINTGKYYVSSFDTGDKEVEIGIRQSRENDKIDSKYGFERVKDGLERTGYLINMHSAELLDEDRRIVAALDLFFIQMDGSRYKISVVFEPYFLVLPTKGQSLELSRFLSKKYAGQLNKIEIVEKEDLDLPNHLAGIKNTFIKMSFPNTNAMIKVRREIQSAVKKNKERAKANTSYMQLLSSSLTGNSEMVQKNLDFLETIQDIREHDVPYHVRVSIDLKINCGLWYQVRCRGGTEKPIITPRKDILERPEPVVLAFDIETTKLPLKFPDAQSDQIMMISYMIDGQGYLITNREIISMDVDDFEYTPKPEFEGNFVVFNETNEMALLQKFFDHIMDIKPHIVVTYNGDFFDWPFVETRAAIYDMDMKQEIGFAKQGREGVYLCRPSMHLDCLCWVKRDSYLPVGSQGLKAVAKAKLRYDPVELDPEEMCKMAVEQPQVLSNYSVSDAVATYYLYMKYVQPFIFALATIIPMEPDEILRKGSGTLCETLLMVEAFHANIIFPNKQQTELNKLTEDGHVLDTETYVGGHVEALESGVFRADIATRFRLDQAMLIELQHNIERVLTHAIEVEEGVPMSNVLNLEEIKAEIYNALQNLHDAPNRLEQPVIYHLDVGAMYPNIILTNRLQPSAMVSETECAACDFNKPNAICKRDMKWLWRGEMLPPTKNEFQRIQQQLEVEKFPPMFPGGPQRAFHELSKEDQAAYERKRLIDYSRKAYKKVKITRLETRTSTVCQKENSFYVDTVRAFRDRRYEYKALTKVAKNAVNAAVSSGDVGEIKAAKGREVLYDSLQLAHKCILNSFYGYVMRRGARWHSMPMAGIVCLTGSNIITKAREIIEKVGRPLELDTDGIWCILPGTFPQEFTIKTNHEKKKKINISYPNAVLNTMVKDYFTNEQYQELVKPPKDGEPAEYRTRNENSIFFEVDGPYLAMVLPAAKEEGKKLKKRYAVFNFDGSLAELKGFEVKRRGELQLIKIFQSSVFESFLQGSTLEECYASVAKIADYWLDVLYSKGANMPDSELFELISENRSMSKKLADYGTQKSSSISTAKRLAEFLGDQMVKDAGLACKYIISRKPEGAPVTERAIPLAIFQSDATVRRHYLRRWLKDNSMGDADIRDVLDWNYYIERLGGTIQKIITIPAALQGLNNPVPRVAHPDWLHKKVLEKNDVLKQRRISEMFFAKPKPVATDNSNEILDIEDVAGRPSTSANIPIATKRKRTVSEKSTNEPMARTWKEALGAPPKLGQSHEEVLAWIEFQKKKWQWQMEARKRRNQYFAEGSKKPRSDRVERRIDKAPISTLSGFLRRSQKSVLEYTWQIIQILPSDDFGNFNIWAMIAGELHKIKLIVPRIFYVNHRSPPPNTPETGPAVWKKVHRILPRARPVFNLYQYVVDEQVFRENRLAMISTLAAPDIEGIYETQISLEFRVLMDLGCTCAVQRSEARKLIVAPTKDLKSFTIQQLEFLNLSKGTYLGNDVNLHKIYLYQHNTPNGKREIWGLFMPPIRKAVIIVRDTVKTNQMPTMKSLYNTERLVWLNSHTNEEGLQPPPEEFNFDIHFEIDTKNVYKHIHKALQFYKDEKKGPTVVCIQTTMKLAQLNAAITILLDFPEAPIHIVDDASLLSGLDWQRTTVRSIVRHFLSLNIVFNLMLDQCRYFHIPIGNMPVDTVLFGADLFFARYLQKHNFCLWWSSTTRPDLGGREADDSRLMIEIEDKITVVQTQPGFYPHVCVELTIDSLAISALLQSNKIQDIEGASSAVAFDVIPQASLEDMMDKNQSVLPSYDETALCSQAFRVMRAMVSGWLREVLVHRNVFADYQIVHFYRWIKSNTALLYDPALRRSLNTLMRKLFLQIIAEFQRLGADIVYADFNKIIINSKKNLITDGIVYSDYIVQSLRKKELFHSVHLTYQHCWTIFLWVDTANYIGIRGKIPKELRNDDTEVNTEATEEEEDEEIALDMICNLIEQLPKEGRFQELFENVLTRYMEFLSQNVPSPKAVKDISHLAYETTLQMNKKYNGDRIDDNPALLFIRALIKILSVDKTTEAEVRTLQRNMLRLLNVGEFSDLAIYKDVQNTYVLNEVICKVCNYCRDLDLCKDKCRAIHKDLPVWLCTQCLIYYDNEDIEARLLEVVSKKLISYTLQDLQCSRCKQIKRENMNENCQCAGDYKTLISRPNIISIFKTFSKIADDHNMIVLKNSVSWILNNVN